MASVIQDEGTASTPACDDSNRHGGRRYTARRGYAAEVAAVPGCLAKPPPVPANSLGSLGPGVLAPQVHQVDHRFTRDARFSSSGPSMTDRSNLCLGSGRSLTPSSSLELRCPCDAHERWHLRASPLRRSSVCTRVLSVSRHDVFG